MEKSLPHTETKPKPQKSLADGAPNGCPENGDSGYGKDIKGRLLAKPQKNNFLTYRIYLKPTVKKIIPLFFFRYTKEHVAFGDQSCICGDMPWCLHGTCHCIWLCCFLAQIS